MHRPCRQRLPLTLAVMRGRQLRIRTMRGMAGGLPAPDPPPRGPPRRAGWRSDGHRAPHPRRNLADLILPSSHRTRIRLGLVRRAPSSVRWHDRHAPPLVALGKLGPPHDAPPHDANSHHHHASPSDQHPVNQRHSKYAPLSIARLRPQSRPQANWGSPERVRATSRASPRVTGPAAARRALVQEACQRPLLALRLAEQAVSRTASTRQSPFGSTRSQHAPSSS